MSSLDLKGATGALLGIASNASAGQKPDIRIHINHPGFVVCDAVSVSEEQLRHWFSRLLSCWPTPEELGSGYQVPVRDVRRRCAPDVGLMLTGNVREAEGFVISWTGGTVRGGASGCIMSFDFDRNRDDAYKLRSEIDDYYRDEIG